MKEYTMWFLNAKASDVMLNIVISLLIIFPTDKHKPDCLHNISRSGTIITSPNYPNNIPRRKCHAFRA